MTVEAQRPSGNPGTAPRGPAGPAPEPHGPKNPSPRPGTQKPPPASPPRDLFLRAIDDALVSALALATTALPPSADRVEACGQAILEFRLRRARAAVADLLSYSGREGRSAAAVSRPDQPPAGTGECLTPGSGTAICPAVTKSADAVVAVSAGTNSRAGGPPSPGAGFDLPVWPGTAQMAASFARRAD